MATVSGPLWVTGYQLLPELADSLKLRLPRASRDARGFSVALRRETVSFVPYPQAAATWSSALP